MTPETGQQQKQCFECRFEASAADGVWETTRHPSLGTITQCPDCGSTDIHSID